MGKTSKPLVILVAVGWEKRPEVEALREKGHRVEMVSWPGLGEPDLILHPAAHAWDETMWPYLEVALKRARVRRYGGKKAGEPD